MIPYKKKFEILGEPIIHVLTAKDRKNVNERFKRFIAPDDALLKEYSAKLFSSTTPNDIENDAVDGLLSLPSTRTPNGNVKENEPLMVQDETLSERLAKLLERRSVFFTSY